MVTTLSLNKTKQNYIETLDVTRTGGWVPPPPPPRKKRKEKTIKAVTKSKQTATFKGKRVDSAAGFRRGGGGGGGEEKKKTSMGLVISPVERRRREKKKCIAESL